MTLAEVMCSNGLPPRIPWDLCKRYRKRETPEENGTASQKHRALEESAILLIVVLLEL